MASVTNRLERYQAFDECNGAYLDWQFAQLVSGVGRRVIEIGCGTGEILRRLPACEAVLGVDVEADILEATEQRFANRADYSFRLMDIATCSEYEFEELQYFGADTVICSNVLEHIRDDVLALQRMEQLVIPGGQVLLLVPAHLLLFGRYDLLDGHYRRYCKRYLRTILQHTGLQVVSLKYFNLLGAVGWWMQYKVLRREIHSGSHFRVMNTAIPLLKPLERWLPVPFGLSLVAVLRRSEVSA